MGSVRPLGHVENVGFQMYFPENWCHLLYSMSLMQAVGWEILLIKSLKADC